METINKSLYALDHIELYLYMSILCIISNCLQMENYLNDKNIYKSKDKTK